MLIAKSFVVKANFMLLTKRIPASSKGRDNMQFATGNEQFDHCQLSIANLNKKNLKTKRKIWLVLPVLTYQKTKEGK